MRRHRVTLRANVHTSGCRLRRRRCSGVALAAAALSRTEDRPRSAPGAYSVCTALAGWQYMLEAVSTAMCIESLGMLSAEHCVVGVAAEGARRTFFPSCFETAGNTPRGPGRLSTTRPKVQGPTRSVMSGASDCYHVVTYSGIKWQFGGRLRTQSGGAAAASQLAAAPPRICLRPQHLPRSSTNECQRNPQQLQPRNGYRSCIVHRVPSIRDNGLWPLSRSRGGGALGLTLLLSALHRVRCPKAAPHPRTRASDSPSTLHRHIYFHCIVYASGWL